MRKGGFFHPSFLEPFLGNSEIDPSLLFPGPSPSGNTDRWDKGNVRVRVSGRESPSLGQDSPPGILRRRNRLLEGGKRCKNGREDLLRLFKFDFCLGRMDIGIHRRRRKAEKEDDYWKSALGNDMAVGFEDGPINSLSLTKR